MQTWELAKYSSANCLQTKKGQVTSKLCFPRLVLSMAQGSNRHRYVARLNLLGGCLLHMPAYLDGGAGLVDLAESGQQKSQRVRRTAPVHQADDGGGRRQRTAQHRQQQTVRRHLRAIRYWSNRWEGGGGWSVCLFRTNTVETSDVIGSRFLDPTRPDPTRPDPTQFYPRADG